MESMRNLDLSLSGLMGLIPHELGNLSNLQHFNLGYNYALQIDNLNWISRLSSLEYLDLSGSDLHKQGSEQKAGPYIVCLAFFGFLANFQFRCVNCNALITGVAALFECFDVIARIATPLRLATLLLLFLWSTA
ncbi:hypothetical protein JHK85_045570 [Glycine max]|nr:hypothetical protein JHK85_045570 [Glycine max]